MSVPTKAGLVLSVAAIAYISVLATRGGGVPIEVSTTHAVHHDLSSSISSNGKVEPITQDIVQSKLTAFVDRLLVKEGQTVTPGQVLMTLDTKDLETQLAHMKEQLIASEDDNKIAAAGGDPTVLAELNTNIAKNASEVVQLRKEGESLARLYAKQAATRQEVEQNQNALAKLQADGRLLQEKLADVQKRSRVQSERAGLRIEEARDSIRSLEEKIRSASVKTAGGGTLYSLPVRPGMFVHEGDVLAELADLRRVQVRIFVDQPDLGLLHEGQSVEITWDGSPGDVWNGSVERLPTRIVARGSRTVGEVICSVEGSNSKLLPNTDIYARIRTAERRNSLVIARNAVRTEGNKHFVFVVDHGRIHKQEIGIGISNSTDYEVLSGISENDLIALAGGSDLHDGVAVKTN